MSSRDERTRVARAIAFYETSDDVPGLYGALQAIAPRVRTIVRDLMRRGDEDSLPGPAAVDAAREPASAGEAANAVKQVKDFALLQALARSIGRRIETIEIVASAELPEGSRVAVPEHGGYPRRGDEQTGTVEESSLTLRVLLDGGASWSGPPSLARRLETPGGNK